MNGPESAAPTPEYRSLRRGMSVPNKFETAILNAAMSAQEFHIEMTDGYYLWYSHESYLQNYIAINVFENQSFYVYVDASPKKIREGSDSISKRPPSSSQRFDLVFWHKTKNQLKAIVEIKRAWNQTPVIEDVKKLSGYITKKDAGGATGYVLYYTHDDAQVIVDRFNRVNDTMRSRLGLYGLTHPVESCICKSGDPPWGFALFRC